MKEIYVLFVLLFSVGEIAAQEIDPDYKHIHPVQGHQTEEKEKHTQEIGLVDQKTNRKSTRSYVVIPSDSIPEVNVQGKKSKKNYKNQFH
jgi:hypothetical protein